MQQRRRDSRGFITETPSPPATAPPPGTGYSYTGFAAPPPPPTPKSTTPRPHDVYTGFDAPPPPPRSNSGLSHSVGSGGSPRDSFGSGAHTPRDAFGQAPPFGGHPPPPPSNGYGHFTAAAPPPRDDLSFVFADVEGHAEAPKASCTAPPKPGRVATVARGALRLGLVLQGLAAVAAVATAFAAERAPDAVTSVPPRLTEAVAMLAPKVGPLGPLGPLGAPARRVAVDAAFHGLVRATAGWRGAGDPTLAGVAAWSVLFDAASIAHEASTLAAVHDAVETARPAGFMVMAALAIYFLLVRGARQPVTAKRE